MSWRHKHFGCHVWNSLTWNGEATEHIIQLLKVNNFFTGISVVIRSTQFLFSILFDTLSVDHQDTCILPKELFQYRGFKILTSFLFCEVPPYFLTQCSCLSQVKSSSKVDSFSSNLQQVLTSSSCSSSIWDLMFSQSFLHQNQKFVTINQAKDLKSTHSSTQIVTFSPQQSFKIFKLCAAWASSSNLITWLKFERLYK